MAAFTSAQDGNWNDGATWGNASPGSKGTDWPGNAGDTVNIGHTVTYNVSETNALGASDIYGTLNFKKDSDTKLVFAHNKLTVKSGGSLLLGTVANPIDTTHTAELYWAMTDDSLVASLIVDNGGTLSMVGVDQMGDTLFSYLTANWTAGQTFTVQGDVTAKWVAGQTVAVHKFQSTFQASIQVSEFTIASMSVNGSDTDITISEAAPGVTFRAGGIVAHLTRNVIFGKYSATLTMGNNNTNRPGITFSHTTVGTVFATLKYVSLVGIYGLQGNIDGRNILDASYCVFRNGNEINFGAVPYSPIDKSIVLSFIRYRNNHSQTISDMLFLGISAGISNQQRIIYENCYFVNCYSGGQVFYGLQDVEFINCDFVDLYSITGGQVYNVIHRNSNIGKYRHHANTCIPTIDFADPTTSDNCRFYNCKFSTDPPTTYTYFYSRQYQSVLMTSDDHDGTLGDTRTWTCFFSTKSNTTVVRDGGSAKSLEIANLLYSIWVGPKTRRPVFEWVEWDVPASEQTRKIYIRGGTGGAENWSTYPIAAELYLEAEYYDEAGTCHKALVASTAVLTDNTTWTAFPVTFTPGRVGQVVYRLRLGLRTGVTGVKLYVDPQLNS